MLTFRLHKRQVNLYRINLIGTYTPHTHDLLAESDEAKKPKTSDKDPARLASIVFVLCNMMGSISWQNNFKNGYKYCETPIRKVIGVIELAREYKFNGSHSKNYKSSCCRAERIHYILC